MKWRLWIGICSWTCFFQLLTIICIYSAKAKVTLKLPMWYIIHTSILWSVSFWINFIWLAAYKDYALNELWSGIGSILPSAHLQLMSVAWVATRQWKPILWLLMLYMRSMSVSIQVKSSQVKYILLHNITSVHTLNTETEAHWGLFASVILAFVTISWPHWETKTRVSKGAICQCAIPCCDGRHHIIKITWNGIISAIKLWCSTILATYLSVYEICSHILFENINGGGILNV